MPGNQIAVASDDLDGNADPIQGSQCRGSACLRWVEEGRKAGEHQFCFVTHHGMGMVHGHLPPGDAQHPEAFFLQRAVLAANRCQRRFIHGAL